ncbi:hypothetical protein GQ54DRAFT_300190 [Martensiomyces pterosporus]|nr:hypothetical protein GQ54DRAFT_300189 [Martensiomyces pterosporus]KAI8318586.1 hypothetical protein GQ54DRAFT_300190 [Martensiomyces pterosporus]
MTAASTRRHKQRVAPGSGQNKRRRAAQNTTGSTSNSSSGGNPNYLGKQAPVFAGNEAPAPAQSLARQHTPSQPDTSQQEGSTSAG